MKNLFLLILIFFVTKSNSQVNSIKRFVLSFEAVYSAPFGDNFLNKCYKPSLGRGFEAQVNFSRLFIGFGNKKSNYSVINKEIIGDFQRAELDVDYLFIGYRHYLKNNIIYFEDRIGYGNNYLKNYSKLSSYTISGKSFFLGSKANYNFKPNLNFYFGIDLISTNYNTDAGGSYKKFYQESYQFEPKLGFKFLFGTQTK